MLQGRKALRQCDTMVHKAGYTEGVFGNTRVGGEESDDIGSDLGIQRETDKAR